VEVNVRRFAKVHAKDLFFGFKLV